MAANSKIEWTDRTWNPVVGCSMVSPGCAHCYAERMAARLKAMAQADIAAGRNAGRKALYIPAINDHGKWSGRLIPDPDSLNEPLGWKKPQRIFVNSMSDLFHESLDTIFIAEVFATMYEAQWHTFQILTKRPARMQGLLADRRFAQWVGSLVWNRLKRQSPEKAEIVTKHDVVADVLSLWPLPNVWPGVSAENQDCWNERVPLLCHTPAARRIVSVEPMLGPIDIHGAPDMRSRAKARRLHQIICGGESGFGASPMHPDWPRGLRDQCLHVGIPFFFKQWGEWAPIENHHVMVPTGNYAFLPSGEKVVPEKESREIHIWPIDQVQNDDSFSAIRVGKKAAGRLLDGREWNEMPKERDDVAPHR